MNVMKRLVAQLLFSFCCISACAQWQWCVSVHGAVSAETGESPEAFLWIPERCDTVRAVIFAQQNMNEETLFNMPSFRDRLACLDVAVVWIAPSLGNNWDVSTGIQNTFDKLLADLAEVSGYSEIATAPLIPFGHSAQATMPWTFAAWNPGRTLCIISYHGDAPRTNLCGYGGANIEWGRTRNIDGIPALMVMGEYEWWDARLRPAMAFRMMYPGSCISFLGDAGRGHFDVSEPTADYIAKFIGKALEYRGKELVPVDPASGWLAQTWELGQLKRVKPAPADEYTGDPHEAFWYFDREMAMMTEARYADTRGKRPSYIGFVQNGRPVPYHKERHLKSLARFLPEDDGVTFHVHPMLTDSTHIAEDASRSGIVPKVKYICGPVKVIDDTTFRVCFNYTGLGNPRRSWDMVLTAEVPSDKRYKEAVQEFEVILPRHITTGVPQAILFPSICDVPSTTEYIPLQARSDRALHVDYYVKYGPAEIVGDSIRLTGIPPRAKFPVEVSVVAWQLGIADSVCTADPVERKFKIYKR